MTIHQRRPAPRIVDSPAFGGYVRGLRHGRNWTQVDIAARLNVTHSYICKLETGRSMVMPSHDLLRRMAAVFGVPEAEMFQRAGKLDLRKLQRMADQDARVARLLFRVQAGALSEDQWACMGADV